MTDESPDPKVVIVHGSQNEVFARTLGELLTDLLRLGGAAVSCHSLAEPSSASTPAAAFAPSAVVILRVLANPDLGQRSPDARAKAPANAGSPRLELAILLTGPMHHQAQPAASTTWGASAEQLEELIGRVAGKLKVQETLDMLAFRPRVEQLVTLAKNSPGYQQHRKRRSRLVAALALGAVAAVSVVYLTGMYQLGYGKFEFEAGDQGWAAQTQGTQGCIAVQQTAEHSKHGSHSLELNLELAPKREASRAGEAFVALKGQTTPELRGPVNLRGKVLSAWVYTPADASGSSDAPNGYQLFVKDEHYHSHYGAWTNAEPDAWTKVELSVGVAAHGATPEPTFSAGSVVEVGLKVQLAGQAQQGFTGSVYLDSVDF